MLFLFIACLASNKAIQFQSPVKLQVEWQSPVKIVDVKIEEETGESNTLDPKTIAWDAESRFSNSDCRQKLLTIYSIENGLCKKVVKKNGSEMVCSGTVGYFPVDYGFLDGKHVCRILR